MRSITDKITQELLRTRRALPFPNAIDAIALHGATDGWWAAELDRLLGYRQGDPAPTGAREFMGFKIVVDPTMPVNRVEIRSGERVLARCDVSTEPLTENQEGKRG